MQTAPRGGHPGTNLDPRPGPAGDAHLSVAAVVIGGALWLLGCLVLAATGHHLLSFLGSGALLGALTALVVYRVPTGAARRPMHPSDFSPYDRRRSGTKHRRFRALGRLVTVGHAQLRRARRLLHRHGAGLPYPVSMPPGARGPGQAPHEPSLRNDRGEGRREAA